MKKKGSQPMPKQSFEKSVEQLEQIIQELEAGDLPLEKAIKRFEEGIKLSKYCFQKLDETEKKVSILMQEMDGSFTEKPLMNQTDESNV
jgi:exodeoxyribonuclease VII small subunit